MRSRITLAAALLVSVSGAGCGLKAFDDAPKREPISIDGVPAGCLAGIPAKIEGYLNGKRRASEIQALSDCVDQALVTFESKTRGANPDVYTAEELREFLNRFFSQDAPLPKGLFGELMKVKQAVVGGQASGFTRAELVRTREILRTLNGAILQLAPVNPDTARPFFARVAAILEDSKNSYDLADADSLLRELEPWVATPDPTTAASRAVLAARADLPVARGAYVLLFPQVAEGKAQEVQAREWRGILEVAADAYEIYWQLDKARAQPSWRRGAGREAFVEAAKVARAALGRIVTRSPGQLLTWTTVNRALEAAYHDTLTLFGKTVKVDGFEQALATVLAKAFGPGRGQPAAGIDAVFLDRAMAVVEDFATTQVFLEQTFAGRGNGRVAAAQLFGGRFPDLAAVAASLPGSLDPRATGELVLPGTWRQVPYGLGLSEYEDLLFREELAELLIRAYAGTGENPRAMVPRSLKESELVQFYMDARPLGIDLKYFDPVDARAPSRRFRDASIFFFPSDGDDRLDLAETTELLRYLISGKTLGDDTHRAIARRCQTGPLDPYGFVTIEPGCYRREFYGRVSSYWATLPALRNYYRSILSAEQAEFGKLLEYLARKKNEATAWYDSDDSESMAAFAQYLETFFTRFDRDGDGLIGGSELELVYEVVDGPLKRLACINQPEVRKAVFNYLIRFGKPPEGGFSGVVQLATSYGRERIGRFLEMWGIEILQHQRADRLQFLRILSELSKAQASGEACSPQ